MSNSSYLKLTSLQRTYVDCRLDGMNQVASAAAAGSKNPRVDGHKLESHLDVQAALVERMQATADEVDFGRKEAHDMYMDAYRNAETAMEQIAAVSAMVKLHGLEKPRIIEVKHSVVRPEEIEYMPTDELMKLAGMTDIVLEGEWEDITDTPKLEPPKVTDDNTEQKSKKVPRMSEDY